MYRCSTFVGTCASISVGASPQQRCLIKAFHQLQLMPVMLRLSSCSSGMQRVIVRAHESLDDRVHAPLSSLFLTMLAELYLQGSMALGHQIGRCIA